MVGLSFSPARMLAIPLAIPAGLHLNMFPFIGRIHFHAFCIAAHLIGVTGGGAHRRTAHLVGAIAVVLFVVGEIAAFAQNQATIPNIGHHELLRLRPIELAAILRVIVKAELALGQIAIELKVRHHDRAPDVDFVRRRINNAVQSGVCIVDVIPMRQHPVDRLVIVDE